MAQAVKRQDVSKVDENRVRRMAEVQGLVLQKSKARREYAPDFGRYRISRPLYRNPHSADGVTHIRHGEPIGFEPVAGAYPQEYGLTLDEAEAWLAGDRTADPIGFSEAFDEVDAGGRPNPALLDLLMRHGLDPAAVQSAVAAQYPTTEKTASPLIETLLHNLARSAAEISFHEKEVSRLILSLKERVV